MYPRPSSSSFLAVVAAVVAAFFIAALPGADAFVVVGPSSSSSFPSSTGSTGRLFSTAVPSDETAATTTTPVLLEFPTVDAARENLLKVCRRLKEENGILVVDRDGKDELKAAVEALERMTAAAADGGATIPASSTEEAERQLVGSWTLLCTTSATKRGIDKSKLPAFLFREGPLQTIRNGIRQAANRYVSVRQVVKAGTEQYDVAEHKARLKIDRVDHVIQYEPPKQLRDLVDNLPEQLTDLDINPLDVSKSKLVLVHAASVVEPDVDDEEVTADAAAPPLLKTKLTLKSIVLNVAGTSTLLDPEGRDLIGVNLPLAEFVSSSNLPGSFGEFETSTLFLVEYCNG